jgi:hypothetical protein
MSVLVVICMYDKTLTVRKYIATKSSFADAVSNLSYYMSILHVAFEVSLSTHLLF